MPAPTLQLRLLLVNGTCPYGRVCDPWLGSVSLQRGCYCFLHLFEVVLVPSMAWEPLLSCTWGFQQVM